MENERHVADGEHCRVIGGTHLGKSGQVQDFKISEGGNATITVVQSDGTRFKTLARNVERIKS